jgi:hypothetical protein
MNNTINKPQNNNLGLNRPGSSYKKEERPSTAPSKESKEKQNPNPYQQRGLQQNDSIKRLPSPLIKSKFHLNNYKIIFFQSRVVNNNFMVLVRIKASIKTLL